MSAVAAATPANKIVSGIGTRPSAYAPAVAIHAKRRIAPDCPADAPHAMRRGHRSAV
jgi:hypothetical protein